MTNPVRSVVVAGGGVAAWTAAAAIANSLRGMQVAITVVEPPEYVAASPVETLPPAALAFHAQLGIDERSIVRGAGATFALGASVHDRLHAGDIERRPYGEAGARIGFLPFHHFVVKRRSAGAAIDMNDYSITAAAAARNAFAHPREGQPPLLARLVYGLNVNAKAYAECLRRYAISLGVNERPGTIAGVQLRANDGFISAVALADGLEVPADLFIDCTGTAELMQGALRCGYHDESRHLPCDRIVSVMARHDGDLDTMRGIRAVAGGWQTRVPLQQRVCHQYLYSSNEAPADALGQFLPGDVPAAGGRPATVRNGWSRRFWYRNCVALGAAAGGFEPVEFTAASQVQTGITRLLGMWPDAACDERIARQYNRLTHREYAHLRDWLAVNYVAEGPAASRRIAVPAMPDSLRARIELFASHGRLPATDGDPFTPEEWALRLIGAGVWPRDYAPLLDEVDEQGSIGHFDRMRASIRDLAAGLPAHREYLRQYCAARDAG